MALPWSQHIKTGPRVHTQPDYATAPENAHINMESLVILRSRDLSIFVEQIVTPLMLRNNLSFKILIVNDFRITDLSKFG